MKNGYYWVKFRDEWQIAKYFDGYWTIIGDDEEIRLFRVEVGDYIETPEKYK